MFLIVASLEATRYQGTSVEHRSLVEACGNLLMCHLSEQNSLFSRMRDEGPLESTRRQKVLMWDGELESTREVFKPEGGDLHEDEDRPRGLPFIAPRLY